MRSILQHAWAEIEHDLGYKASTAIPAPIKRRFHRLAGLLEVADDEFMRIRDDLRSYASHVEKAIPEAPAGVLIDKVSIEAFLRGPSVGREVDEAMAQLVGGVLDESQDVEDVVEEMRYLGFRTIEDIQEALTRRRELVLGLFRLRMADPEESWSPPRGISLFYLFQVILAESGDRKVINEGFARFDIRDPSGMIDEGEALLSELRTIASPSNSKGGERLR